VTATQKLPLTSDLNELEKRSYMFLDAITEKILSDTDFQKAFAADTKYFFTADDSNQSPVYDG